MPHSGLARLNLATHGRVVVIAASALRVHSKDRGLISAWAPADGGEIFLGAVGAFAMNSYAARAWGGHPIAARRLRFSAGPRLPEPHERSCSRGF